MLWGHEHGDLTYWEALQKNRPNDWTISPAERRAVGLLFELVDRERALRYLVTGEIYVRGNTTGTLYKVQRCAPKVLEYDDRGRCVATWCIHADGGHYFMGMTDPTRLPKTDEIITLKNLIEGEEIRFKTIGNRTQRPLKSQHDFGQGFRNYDPLEHYDRTPDYKRRGVTDPYAVDFMGGMMPLICHDAAVALVAKHKAAEQDKYGGMDDYLAAPGYDAPLYPGDALAYNPNEGWGHYPAGGNGVFGPYQYHNPVGGSWNAVQRLKKGGTVDQVGRRTARLEDVLLWAALNPKRLDERIERQMERQEHEVEAMIAARANADPSIL